jgi:DNA-binding transcriptional MocR family regulator
MSTISFARGAPSPDCLDVELLSGCAQAALDRDGSTILSYGAGGGYGPLRAVLGERHGVEPERVFVTTGGLQGFVFYAAAQLQRRPGRVLVEGPTYDRPLKLLGWEGAEVVSLPMDDEGLDPDALERELAGPPGSVSFLYTIPTFQNPSGRTLGTERRERLVALTAEYDLDVLEDDPYGQVRYEGESPPSLHELEGGNRVSFTSSFSKTVAPGLRVGYVVVPESLRAAYEDKAVSTYISPSLLPQATVHELISRGAFEPNLERIRALLGARRDAMLAALASTMPDGVSWSRPEGGYFLWVDFPDDVDAADLLRRATDAGVTFVPGADFYPDGAGGTSSARLAFSFETPERIGEGVELLAVACRQSLSR